MSRQVRNLSGTTFAILIAGSRGLCQQQPNMRSGIRTFPPNEIDLQI